MVEKDVEVGGSVGAYSDNIVVCGVFCCFVLSHIDSQCLAMHSQTFKHWSTFQRRWLRRTWRPGAQWGCAATTSLSAEQLRRASWSSSWSWSSYSSLGSPLHGQFHTQKNYIWKVFSMHSIITLLVDFPVYVKVSHKLIILLLQIEFYQWGWLVSRAATCM